MMHLINDSDAVRYNRQYMMLVNKVCVFKRRINRDEKRCEREIGEIFNVCWGQRREEQRKMQEKKLGRREMRTGEKGGREWNKNKGGRESGRKRVEREK